MRNLSPTSLQQLLDIESERLLLDVREEWEFEICNIASSVNIPMQEIPESLHKLDPKTETVLICHHGARSLQVGHYLEHAGFENLINLDGGVDAWSRDVDQTMPQY